MRSPRYCNVDVLRSASVDYLDGVIASETYPSRRIENDVLSTVLEY
jgi:hypothetical protein